MEKYSEIIIDGQHLTVDMVYRIAHAKDVRLRLSQASVRNVLRSRRTVEDIISSGKTVYGINTGFGSLKDKNIPQEKIEFLQENLIKSHAVGVGESFSKEEVRGAMVIRANSLSRGYSGVRREVIEKIFELLHKDIYPYIPQIGSVGASGDLAPLSHLALVLMGKGEVIVDGKRHDAQFVLKKQGIEPIVLQAKEGLALNNGTAFLTAVAAMNLYRVKYLTKWFDNALALSLEGLAGTLTAFDPRIHALRSHPGQIVTAEIIRRLCQKSQLVGPNNGYSSIQDSYSLRCSPQVHGCAKDLLRYVEGVVETELNAVTDNPLICSETGEALSGGNFHGEPIALAMDCLSIAVTELANISERRIAKLMDSHHNNGLPPYLIGSKETGLNSGFMIAQYTAAALLAEMKVLAHPVVIDSIPTSANQEDYVSFGATASRKCRDIIAMAEKIAAIEILCACQALDLRKPLKPGLGARQIFTLIRKKVPFITNDEIMYPYIETVLDIISERES